jgi:hypothetical protein
MVIKEQEVTNGCMVLVVRSRTMIAVGERDMQVVDRKQAW